MANLTVARCVWSTGVVPVPRDPSKTLAFLAPWRLNCPSQANRSADRLSGPKGRYIPTAVNLPDKSRAADIPARGFWLKALGWVLLVGSVGLVSCQALFSL